MIHFTWKEKKYSVADEAYDSDYIVLPDGVILRPTGWLESFPPQLAGAVEIKAVVACLQK